MPRPKIIKDQVRMFFVVSKAQAKQIEKIAEKTESQDGKRVTVSAFLRALVAVACPVPKNQMDLFS